MRFFISITVIIMAAGITTFGQNYKIKQSTSMNGQTYTSTVYVKGSRKRTENGAMMGMGGDIADIEQCDLKRNVKVSDKKKLYVVEPFATDAEETKPAGKAPPLQAGSRTARGGTVTITTSIVDTGERKQMYGLTARRIKTSMTMQSSPDACSQQDTSIESDGWYIDLPQFSCPVTTPRNPYSQPGMRGCVDRTVVKNTGSGKLGFPLTMTQTIRSGGQSGMAFTQTIETVEFSKAALDDALFDIPAGYRQANSASDLYGQPDYSAMTKGMPAPSDEMSAPKPVNAKRPGLIRIGVLMPANKTAEGVSAAALQGFLAQQLTSGNFEGVAVATEAQAKAAGCDYIVSTDISKMKQSTASKFGGLLGKVTSTDTSGAQNFDAQVDFRLKSLTSGQQVLQNKASGKFNGTADRAAENVLSMEAAAVMASAK